MAFDYHIQIPENSRQGKVIKELADRLSITPEEAIERVFEDGLQAQESARTQGDIWGLGADDADALDAIVSTAMASRRSRFLKRVDAQGHS